MAGHGREALRCMQEAHRIVIACDEASPYVAVLLASALTVAGRAREAREAFAALDAFLDEVDPLTPLGQSLVVSLSAHDLAGRLRARRAISQMGRPRARVGLAGLPRAPPGLRRRAGLPARSLAGRARPGPQEAVRALEETGQRGPWASRSSPWPRSRRRSAGPTTAGRTRAAHRSWPTSWAWGRSRPTAASRWGCWSRVSAGRPRPWPTSSRWSRSPATPASRSPPS